MDMYLLEMKMKKSGVTNEQLAKLLKIDPATLYRKKVGESDFYRREIQMIRTELNLTPEEVDLIFFNQ